MSHIIQGVIRGNTIELKENPGLSDGEEIDVILRPRRVAPDAIASRPGQRPTAAGMLAHLPPQVDRELEKIIRERKQGVFREIPQ